MSYHAARALLADEASSNAAGMGLVNVSIEESYQVNEDAFHDRIIKVRNPGQPNVCASDGARVFPLTDFPVRGLPTPTRAHLSLSKTPQHSTPINTQEVTADESHELVAAFSMTVMLTILLLVIILGATIKHYNITWLHQSGAALLLGTIVGFVVWYVRRDPMYQDNGTGESQRMTSFVEWIMFDTEFFFLVLLPPVIFESGYTLNPETLFRNFDAISVFAFLGTFVSTLVVGFIMYGAGMAGLAYRYTLRDAMLFGSLISSTDPVTTLSIFNDMGLDPDIHAVVLGESLLNDAISIVLFEALFMFGREKTGGGATAQLYGAMDTNMPSTLGVDSLGENSELATAVSAAMGAHGGSADDARYSHGVTTEVAFTELAITTFSSFIGVFFSSLLIGGAVGACSAMLHKYISITGDWDEGWVIDSALVLMFPYLAYTIAESANLSGIVAVLFCGMVMGRYTRQNLDKAPRMVTMCFFKLVAFLSETFVFIYMGSSMCTISLTHLVTAVISLFAIFIGRVANVFPGSYLLNATLRPTEEYGRLSQNTQMCLWYCGLRGAVAYALAMKAAATLGEPGQAMLSSTLFVVMFTVLFMGGSTTYVLQKLGIIDHAPRFGPGGLANRGRGGGGQSRGQGERGKEGAVGSLGKGMAGIAGNPMSPPRPSNKNRVGTNNPPGTPGDHTAVTLGADTSTPLLSESEHAADRRERRHRRGGAYRALRQFDFKYLQPLLLATPMKRLPREERPGRKGESGSNGGRAQGEGYGSGGSSGRGSPERPEGKGLSRNASHGDLPDEVFSPGVVHKPADFARATEAERSYRVFAAGGREAQRNGGGANRHRVNADGTPMWGTDEV